MDVVLAIFGIGLLIFVHELGHYVAARLLGVRVEEFMIGLPGPRLVSFVRKGTRYGITLIPFGGYVRLAGEFLQPDEDGEQKPPASDEFVSKSTWKKITIIAAGPILNAILPVFLFAAIFVLGVDAPSTNVAKVLPDSAAAAAGIEPGDRIVGIAGTTVESWEELVREIQRHPDDDVDMRVVRDGAEEDIEVHVGRGQDGRGFLGIEAALEKQRFGPIRALSLGVRQTVVYLGLFMRLLVTETIGGRLLKQSAGPIGIAVETSRAVSVGIDFYLTILALISLNLMIVNLLPVPPLDGGRIFINIIESIRRKPLRIETIAALQAVGILLFIVLMVYLVTADLQRYGLWRFELWNLE